MLGYLGAFVKTCGPFLAKATVSYGADVVGSHVAYNQLHNAKDDIQSGLTSVGGEFVGPIGDLLGRAVAGHGIDFTLNQKDSVATALGNIGNEFLDPSQADKTGKEHSVNVLNCLSQAGKLVVPVAMACGALPVGPSFMATALIKGVPDLYNAFTSPLEKKSENEMELLRDVMVPAAADLAIQATGSIVQGAVVYNEITFAHDARIELGEKLGRGLSSYFPMGVQNFVGGVGRAVATIDAPRHALSSDVVTQAVDKAGRVKTITEFGLHAINSTVKKQTKRKASNYFDTARNTAILGAGILGGGALFAFTPMVAPYIAGAALLNAAPKAVLWTRQSLSGDSLAQSALSDENTFQADESDSDISSDWGLVENVPMFDYDAVSM